MVTTDRAFMSARPADPTSCPALELLLEPRRTMDKDSRRLQTRHLMDSFKRRRGHSNLLVLLGALMLPALSMQPVVAASEFALQTHGIDRATGSLRGVPPFHLLSSRIMFDPLPGARTLEAPREELQFLQRLAEPSESTSPLGAPREPASSETGPRPSFIETRGATPRRYPVRREGTPVFHELRAQQLQDENDDEGEADGWDWDDEDQEWPEEADEEPQQQQQQQQQQKQQDEEEQEGALDEGVSATGVVPDSEVDEDPDAVALTNVRSATRRVEDKPSTQQKQRQQQNQQSRVAADKPRANAAAAAAEEEQDVEDEDLWGEEYAEDQDEEPETQQQQPQQQQQQQRQQQRNQPPQRPPQARPQQQQQQQQHQQQPFLEDVEGDASSVRRRRRQFLNAALAAAQAAANAFFDTAADTPNWGSFGSNEEPQYAGLEHINQQVEDLVSDFLSPRRAEDSSSSSSSSRGSDRRRGATALRAASIDEDHPEDEKLQELTEQQLHQEQERMQQMLLQHLQQQQELRSQLLQQQEQQHGQQQQHEQQHEQTRQHSPAFDYRREALSGLEARRRAE
ncbi:hypothetical protein Esti_001723 [Eimeria stiedai]